MPFKGAEFTMSKQLPDTSGTKISAHHLFTEEYAKMQSHYIMIFAIDVLWGADWS